MSRAERAREYFLEGYACAQAVVAAFSDLTGLDEPTAMKVSLPFGGGTGRLRLTCGALNGAFIVLGLLRASDEVNRKNKTEVYSSVQELARRFEKRFSSINCGELLRGANVAADTSATPEERSGEYYKKRPCPELVYGAAEILEEYLKELS